METKTIEYGVLRDIVKEKWKPFFILGLVMLILSIAIAFLIPKKYKSDVMFQVKPRSDAAMSANSSLLALSGLGGADSSLTYMAILRSNRVLDPVIEKLDMPEEDKKEFTAYDFSKKYMEINNPRGTDILTFSIEADSPEEAQAIAQNVTKSFQLALSDLSGTQDSGIVKLLNKKVEDAKKDLDQKIADLEKYKQENGVYAPTEQEKNLLEQSAGYDKAKADAEVQLNTNLAIASNMESQLSDQNAKVLESKMADNAEIQDIRSKLLNANQNLASLQFKFTDDHPEVLKAEENIKYLNQQLDQTISKAVQSEAVSLSPAQAEIMRKRIVAESNADAAKASIAVLNQLSQDNLATTNAFSEKSVRFFELQRDVTIAKESYSALVKSTEDLKMKENLDSMDVRIVDPASLPNKHSWPRKLPIVLGAGVLYVIIVGGYMYIRYSRITRKVS